MHISSVHMFKRTLVQGLCGMARVVISLSAVNLTSSWSCICSRVLQEGGQNRFVYLGFGQCPKVLVSGAEGASKNQATT